MRWDFQKIQQSLEEEVSGIIDDKGLEAFRIKYLGKKGLLPEIYASFSTLTSEEKAAVGKGANDLKEFVNRILAEKNAMIQSKASSSAHPALDVTLPGVAHPVGHKHVLSQTIQEICEIFEQLGFVIHDSPEIETEFNNFTALNIPIDHPSRDAFDTFYLDWPDPTNKGRKLLLRSQTSPG